MSKFKFIDLFCGIGGFHHALAKLGGECVFASDIDVECQKTYFDNFGLMPIGDITKVDEKEIPEFDVLSGGFPCQSFSKAGNRKGTEDPRGTLFFDIIRIAKHHKPKYMILENVRNLAKHDNGRTWSIIYQNLIDIGYSVNENPIIFSPHYIGIPQHRERVYIICQRNDVGIVPPFNFLPDKSIKCSIDDVLLDDSEIENIDAYKLSGEQVELIEIWNDFTKNIKAPLPGFPVWADRLKELDSNENLDLLPKWKSGFIVKNHNLYKNNQSFLDGWLKRAYKLSNFKGSKTMFEWQAGQTENPDIWNTIMHFRPSGLRVKRPNYFPALVAITQTSIIGKRKRTLCPREAARMQSFPDTAILNSKDKIAYKQLGNSVNVRVVEMFSKFLLDNKHFKCQEYGLKNNQPKAKQEVIIFT